MGFATSGSSGRGNGSGCRLCVSSARALPGDVALTSSRTCVARVARAGVVGEDWTGDGDAVGCDVRRRLVGHPARAQPRRDSAAAARRHRTRRPVAARARLGAVSYTSPLLCIHATNGTLTFVDVSHYESSTIVRRGSLGK